MLNGISLALIMAGIALVVLFAISITVNRLLAPLVRTPKGVLDEVIKAFDLKSSDTIIDLGSGYGDVVLEAYAKVQCKCIGYDISPIPVMVSRIKKAIMFPMKKNISFELADVFSIDLNGNPKVYCYLNRTSLEILREKLVKIIKSGGVVYSYMYEIPDVKRSRVLKLKNGDNLYVYSKRK